MSLRTARTIFCLRGVARGNNEQSGVGWTLPIITENFLSLHSALSESTWSGTIAHKTQAELTLHTVIAQPKDSPVDPSRVPMLTGAILTHNCLDEARHLYQQPMNTSLHAAGYIVASWAERFESAIARIVSPATVDWAELSELVHMLVQATSRQAGFFEAVRGEVALAQSWIRSSSEQALDYCLVMCFGLPLVMVLLSVPGMVWYARGVHHNIVDALHVLCALPVELKQQVIAEVRAASVYVREDAVCFDTHHQLPVCSLSACL